ncbi:cystathionine gamma-lyase [Granulicella tundricola]|uniref:Cys/Met metabolism pyridoxal-phosphate-dependent protein n=1 Tax=Granulicella tundricola (strain ATCC BAA-1859 / DSM 23138 / MP5ACTX9) TaxID=1198114 RepID=E8WYH4_GRATM|nr:cystathionine gamma-lyase [Granulicella tundricola]ADW69880.1 Cys/Met metabolism pyridoxal-phosphate-dependent protein [Granulicella tundricola MP5ACTX9]
MHPETKLLHAALTPATAGEPLHAGPVFATAFHTPGDPAQAPYTYARSHNPTWTHLESAISGLEHPEAQTRIFASGLAAVHAAFASTLRPGDTIVFPDNCYFTARQLLQEHFAPIGVYLRPVPTALLTDPATLSGARLLWLETPSNPNLEITDIRAAVAVAHAAGVLVAVDNTTATPYAQQPLALGADLSVSSDSKSLTGHSDLLLGHVSTRDSALAERIDRHRTLTGAIAGPMEAWLALRSLATLPLRLDRTCANAQAIAEFLQTRFEVTEVLYPGLPTHPGHSIAAAQMTHFGTVVCFTLPSEQAANQFLTNSALITQATSFGGQVTTAERRARWGHDRIAPGFIRLSAGAEHLADLVADLSRALDSIK